MLKNNVRMVVQSFNETAQEFAERLESICLDLSIKNKDKINGPPFIFLTSAGDGRQTATIQFVTNESDFMKEATFNGHHLKIAFDRFKMKKEEMDVDALLDFLLKENMEDYK